MGSGRKTIEPRDEAHKRADSGLVVGKGARMRGLEGVRGKVCRIRSFRRYGRLVFFGTESISSRAGSLPQGVGKTCRYRASAFRGLLCSPSGINPLTTMGFTQQDGIPHHWIPSPEWNPPPLDTLTRMESPIIGYPHQNGIPHHWIPSPGWNLPPLDTLTRMESPTTGYPHQNGIPHHWIPSPQWIPPAT
jgi:hypothetical protein